MTKTKKTNKTELVVMGYFVEQITDIYGMFVGSNESIRSIYILSLIHISEPTRPY